MGVLCVYVIFMHRIIIRIHVINNSITILLMLLLLRLLLLPPNVDNFDTGVDAFAIITSNRFVSLCVSISGFDFSFFTSPTLCPFRFVCRWYAHLPVAFSRGDLFIHQSEEYTFTSCILFVTQHTHTNAETTYSRFGSWVKGKQEGGTDKRERLSERET